ncbi:putative ribonuclease H-like domain-containing protein [Tanacetum coccineum]|uniref:Ribonuclease H-like domain-containing protein n=1 Tax=Tanacetum coccineum TaxID=301880 RepID=A0ABQ5H3M7_9ASTR
MKMKSSNCGGFELLQFKLQEVWTLVELPNRKRAIGTKWVFRNKKRKKSAFVKIKIMHDWLQQWIHTRRGINYDEVFAHVARIEAIRLFLAYASFKDFVVYQMDVKSAFLYCKIEEEDYVCQPPGFEDPNFPDRVYKVEKALYGLHQAPRAWYETLSTYLLDNWFQRGKIDKTLFIRRDKGDILLVQVYVDDIIFGSTKKSLCTEFKKMMHKKFQISFMGELTFFLGLQVKQKEDGTFISQDKYVNDILNKFGFSDVKTARTPMETQKALLKDVDGEDVDEHLNRSMIGSLMYLTSSRPDIMFAVCACARFQVNPKVSHLHAVKRIFRYLKGQPKLGLWYPKDSPFDLVAYTDSDYAGASLDRKSTIKGCQFLRCRLISWQCKKQTVVANSTTEAEYIAASNCCGQNPVFHSKTKHIEIRHHFIRDSNEKKLIQMIKIHTDQNVADLLTKAFDRIIHKGCLEWNEKAAKDEIGVIILTTAVIINIVSIERNCAKTTAWNEFSSTMASAIICLATNQKFNFSKNIFDNMVKNLEGGVKFLMYLRFVQVSLDKQVEVMFKHKEIYVTPSHTKKVIANMKRQGKDFSGRDTPLFPTMIVQAQEQVGEGSEIPTDSHHTPTTTQPSTSKPQKKQSRRKQRKDTEDPQLSGPTEPVPDDTKNVASVHIHSNDPLVSGILNDEEVFAEQDVVEKEVSTAKVVIDSATTTTVDELTLAQTLIEIKAAKPKAITTAATTTTTAVTKPRARRVIVQEPSKFTTTTSPSQPSQLTQAKDKGKAKMVEPEKPLKKKNQIMFDKEVAQKLQTQLDVKLEEEEKLARQREKDANIAEWDNVQSMMDADYELATILQAEKQGELTIKEKLRLFMELMNKRKKHFARLRAEE